MEGPEQQRLGILLGFDGSPFSRGYTTAAFGPGNDRIFNFESGNDFEGIGKNISIRAGAARLSGRTQLWVAAGRLLQRLRGSEIAPLYLDALTNPSEAVRDAATEVADKVALGGESQTLGKLVDAARNSASQLAVLKLLRANRSLLESKEFADLVRRSAADPKLGSVALPLMAAPGFSDAEALAALLKSWPRAFAEDGGPQEAAQPIDERNSLLSQRTLEASRRGQTAEPPQAFVDCVALLDQRPGLLQNTEALRKLGSAAVVDNGKARQLVFELLLRHPEIATHPSMLPLVRPGAERYPRRSAARGAGHRSQETLKCVGVPDFRTT